MSGVPILELADITVRYGAVQALSDVSLAVDDGAFVGLIGPNGAGKTSLFNVISGFTKPYSGVTSFNGTRIPRAPHRRARLGLVRTFQNVGLNRSATVDENLRAALTTGRFQVEFADLFGGSSDLERRILGFEETHQLFELGKYRDVKVSDLSTGVAKMVELACAVLRQPRLLLLDEPSSGLSPDETDRLGVVLRQLHAESDMSILMIEHDMPLIMRSAEYMVCLDFGTVIARGTPAEVRNNKVVIDAYLGEG